MIFGGGKINFDRNRMNISKVSFLLPFYKVCINCRLSNFVKVHNISLSGMYLKKKKIPNIR